MFEKIGKLKYINTNLTKVTIDISSLKKGVNCLEDYIVVKEKEIKVYDRICNHKGGKIISKSGKHICPMHNWEFLPSAGIYKNKIKKKELSYKIENKNIVINKFDSKPEISTIQNKKIHKTEIEYYNHAFLKIKGDNYKFATDPWAIGPAFNMGWWLKDKTNKNWLKELNSSNFIYISHNHPDHLHKLTLSKISKNIPIVVPRFNSDSTGKFIEELGFKNILRAEFEVEYRLTNTSLIFTLLKSGDFRDDSGIYFSNGNFKGLLDVDSNMINFNKFPNLDFYASSFAGGASGYPLMFDNYNDAEKIKLVESNKNFFKIKKVYNLKKIKPNFFLPYAGSFESRLPRDQKIEKTNIKNKIVDYQKICKLNNIQLLNVENNEKFIFKNDSLIKKIKTNKPKQNDYDDHFYEDFFKKNYKIVDENYIKKYFINSKFKDNLHLYLSLTDKNFKIMDNYNYFVNFSKKKIIFKKVKKININKNFNKNKKINFLHLKCRKESFLNTVYNKEPWEDLLIGFQCRVLRYPNQYNADFWYHFTNIYVSEKNIRFSSKCSNCDQLLHLVDNILLKT